MARWEYKQLENGTPLGDAFLNTLGAEGWELVGFTSIEIFGRATFHYVFRRAL